MGMITIGGIHAPCAPVWRDAIEFGPVDGWRTRYRQVPPDMIVLHWTGGENSPSQVRRVLGRRNLSVHFIVDGWGEVWQYEDPVHTVCLHAGAFNERSVGVEIVNYGFRPKGSNPPRMAEDRRQIVSRVHGRTLVHAAFRPEQSISVLALCDVLTAHIPSIPRNVICHSELGSKEELDIGGVVGHYHLNKNKVDPGPGLLSEVAVHWGVIGGSCA